MMATDGTYRHTSFVFGSRDGSPTGNLIGRALIFRAVQSLYWAKQTDFVVFPSIIKTNKSLVGEATRPSVAV